MAINCTSKGTEPRKVIVLCAKCKVKYVTADYYPAQEYCWKHGDLPVAYCPECEEQNFEREILGYLTLSI